LLIKLFIILVGVNAFSSVLDMSFYETKTTGYSLNSL
jgi:hypothetical protein